LRECAATSVIALAALSCALPAPAQTVRSKADLRTWQVVHDRSSQLTWPWASGADSATLFFSNCVTHVVSSLSVVRGEGETHGGCAHPVASSHEESLFDVLLVQTAGGVAVSEDSATLAYVSGTGGGPITVRPIRTHELDRIRKPRVYAFDPAWIGMAGDSGHAVAWPTCSGLSIIIR